MSCFFPSGDGKDIGTLSLLRAILLTQLTRDLSYIKLEIIFSCLNKNRKCNFIILLFVLNSEQCSNFVKGFVFGFGYFFVCEHPKYGEKHAEW